MVSGTQITIVTGAYKPTYNWGGTLKVPWLIWTSNTLLVKIKGLKPDVQQMSPQRSAAIRRSSGVLGDGSRFLQFDLGQSQGAVNCAVADLHGGPAAGGFLHFYRWYGCHSQSWVVYDTIEVDDLRVPPWLRKLHQKWPTRYTWRT